MTPTAGRAVEKSPSQARVMPPSPTSRRIWLTTPLEDSSQLHMMPAATSGMICGTKRTVRETRAILLAAKPRMVLAVNRPSATGMMLKNRMSSKAWTIDPDRSGFFTSAA